MLRKRIIFTLIYDNDFFTQSRNFRLQKVGNINWLEKNYQFQKISFSLDELIILNATKGKKDLKKFASTLNRLVDNVFIPISAGGGIETVEDAALLFNNGADKIVLNSALYNNKSLVKELISIYGSQSIVASVDYKMAQGKRIVYINDGSLEIDFSFFEYIKYLDSLDIGEIYLNSIDQDGTGFGYDLDVIKEIPNNIKAPLIIAGGAGNESHLIEALEKEDINAAATANLFNFIGDGLPNGRKKILDAGLNIAKWI